MHRNPAEFILLHNYNWEWRLSQNELPVPSETHLEESDFSFCLKYQFQVAACLGLGLRVHLFFLVQELHLVSTCAGSVNVATISVHSYMHLPVLTGRYCFLWIIWLWYLPSLPLLSLAKGLMEILQLGLSAPNSLHIV